MAQENEIRVQFHDEVRDELLQFAVIIARTKGKWIFCRHRERQTFEIPGGHRERGEDILATAKRELREETGATAFDIRPMCAYSVKGKTRVNRGPQDISYGMVYCAEVHAFEALHSEIAEILITDGLPERWTYPFIAPLMLEEAARRGFVPAGETAIVGLRRGTVALRAHDARWEAMARETMDELHAILGPLIRDIAHVGSTAIRTICAKPIIDIAVAVDDFDAVLTREAALRSAGFYYRPGARASLEDQLLFACGNYYAGTGDLQTHFIHVVRAGSRQWRDYILMRDYMNAKPREAAAYEALKLELAGRAPVDPGREQYTSGKHAFITRALSRALAWSYLGRTVDIVIDRPLGSAHPEHPDMIYPVNYGGVAGETGGDGELLDAYLLGVDEPVRTYSARVVGVVYRMDDVEDKLVAAPQGMHLTAAQIAQAVDFTERYFTTEIETAADEKAERA